MFVVTRTFQRGGKTYSAGTVLEASDETWIGPILRVGWITIADEAPQPPQETIAEPVKPKAKPKKVEPVKPTYWRAKSVDELDLEEKVLGALRRAKFEIVDDVLRYVAEHDGLTDIRGIGEAHEQSIRAAIKKLKDG